MSHRFDGRTDEPGSGRAFFATTEDDHEIAGEQSAAGLVDRARLIVLGVEPDSPGAAAGLQPRDVIAEGNSHPIGDVAALRSLLAAGREIELIVVRNQARITLPWPRAAATSANPSRP